MIFEYGTITLYGTPFQGVSSNQTPLEISENKLRYNFEIIITVHYQRFLTGQTSPKCSPSKTFVCTTNAPDVIFLQPPPRAPREKIQISKSKFQNKIFWILCFRLWISLCEAQGLFSFPPLTEMFHFSGFARTASR